MKLKTSELIGPALDWAVAKAQELDAYRSEAWIDDVLTLVVYVANRGMFRPSTDWAQGGPIIERELIQVNVKRLIGTSESGAEVDIPEGWQAHKTMRYWQTPNVYFGPTPLIAAMRCYCCVKLGDEVEIPEELL